MAVPPGPVRRVVPVACHLGGQAPLVHGGEVDLDEGASPSGLAIDVEGDLDVGVGPEVLGLAEAGDHSSQAVSSRRHEQSVSPTRGPTSTRAT